MEGIDTFVRLGKEKRYFYKIWMVKKLTNYELTTVTMKALLCISLGGAADV